MTQDPDKSDQDKKPRGVNLIGWGVVILGLVNTWRVIGLWQQTDFLLVVGDKADPRVHLVMSGLWVIVFFVSSALIFLRRPLAQFVPLMIFLYGLYRIVQLILFGEDDSLSIYIIGYTAMTVLAIWSLNRRAARRFFDVHGQVK